MISIHVGGIQDGTVFALSPRDQQRFKGHPSHVFLSGELRDTPKSVRAWTSHWPLIASMLTGLSLSKVKTKGFRVMRYPFGEGDVNPLPEGPNFLHLE